MEADRHWHNEAAGIVGVLPNEIHAGRGSERAAIVFKPLLVCPQRLFFMHIHQLYLRGFNCKTYSSYSSS
jgi:hypothetical protein